MNNENTQQLNIKENQELSPKKEWTKPELNVLEIDEYTENDFNTLSDGPLAS